MTQPNYALLRCIWAEVDGHAAESDLEVRGSTTEGLLVCRGCAAVYLLNRGVPVMMNSKALTRANRQLLRGRCKALGVSPQWT